MAKWARIGFASWFGYPRENDGTLHIDSDLAKKAGLVSVH